MTKEEAREINLETILLDLGYTPVRKNPKESWYFLRDNDRKAPSFKINFNLNRWYDFGIGQGGNAIDLVMLIKNCSFIDAIDYLKKFEHQVENINVEAIKQQRKIYKENQEDYKILEVKNIFMYPLKNYLKERMIDFDIAEKYLKEIHFDMSDRKQYALCMKNNSGGYAFRSAVFKGNLGSQNITTIDNGKEEAIFFEGFFNFLSYATLNKNNIDKYNFEILNTANNIHNLEEKKYRRIFYFGDNDKTGRELLEKLKIIFPQTEIIDKTNLYNGYNDLNEWHMSQNVEIKKLKIKRS